MPTGEPWTPAQVAERLARGEIELIDVRLDYERVAGHIPGSRHIELGELSGSAGSIPRDRPVVLQCRVGGRSAMAAQALHRAGWDAHNMSGGAEAWVAAGLPFEGVVAEH